MPKQLQIFENSTGKDLEVYIEVFPDRYLLKPGDVMQISYDHDGAGYGLHTHVHADGLQIYLDNFDTAVVTINGQPVEPWGD